MGSRWCRTSVASSRTGVHPGSRAFRVGRGPCAGAQHVDPSRRTRRSPAADGGTPPRVLAGSRWRGRERARAPHERLGVQRLGAVAHRLHDDESAPGVDRAGPRLAAVDRDGTRAVGSNGSGTRRRRRRGACRSRRSVTASSNDPRSMLHARCSSAGHRVLTLTGLGGIGKTRIALTVAATMADVFVGGVELVDLTSCVDAETLHHRIASDLGIHVPGGHHVSQAILRSFAMRAGALVVLDNAEHVGVALVALVRATLEEPSGATLLVTSRAPLDVQGERTLSIGPLSLEPSGDGVSPAAALFLDRTSAAGIAVGQADAERIVRALDGVPLAIELAAARARSIPLHDLERHLVEGTLPLLRPADANARHSSLDAVLEQSWGDLDADLQSEHGEPDGARGNVLVRAGPSGDAAHAARRRRTRRIGLARDAAVRRRPLPDARAHGARSAAQGHPRRTSAREARSVPGVHSVGERVGTQAVVARSTPGRGGVPAGRLGARVEARTCPCRARACSIARTP